jgi:hypothetical protein
MTPERAVGISEKTSSMSNEARIRRLLTNWQCGALVDVEFTLQFFLLVAKDEVDAAFRCLTPEARELVERKVASAAQCDEDWGKVLIVQSYCGKPLSREESRRQEAAQLRQYRLGVEAVRAYLDTKASE